MSAEFDNFVEIIRVLRSPQGCPWDREQTLYSLIDDFTEETYEAIEALENRDIPNIREEFGDVLLHVVLHAQIASEAGLFDIKDVITEISEKIIRRHPHVFSEHKHEDKELILQQWDEIKKKEKNNKKTRFLDKANKPAPTLIKAQKLQDAAAKTGFDWPEKADVIDKIAEEFEELKSAVASSNTANIKEELGDMIFAIANLARHCGVSCEDAVKDANKKFVRRFNYIEDNIKDINSSPLEEMERLWQDAKKTENRH